MSRRQPASDEDPKKAMHADLEGLDKLNSCAQGHADTLDATRDAVFGEIGEGGPNYRDVGWLGTVALMMKTQLGLGILSIPKVFDAVGMVPGVICILVIGGITTWSGYQVGVFKRLHPHVYGIDDVGGIFFGPIGREVFGVVFGLYFVFCASSGMLGISISLNAISNHGACTAVFVAVAALVGFGLCSIQTLGKITWLAWVGLASIIVSIFTVTIAVGLQERPAAAPTQGPWVPDYKLFNNPTFQEAASGLASIIFAFAAVPAYFSIVSEMRDPRLFTRALLVGQGLVTALYVAIGVVIYYYCGSYVASPALGSAGPLIKKVCYGLALPGIAVSTCLLAHYPAKYFFVRVLRNSRHLAKNTPTHWAVWFGCTGSVAVVAYIIASVVPVFGGLVALVGASLGTLMCFQPMGAMWLYDNWHAQRGRLWNFKAGWAVFVIASGSFLMVAGSYGAVVDIAKSYSGQSGAFTCVDNSGTVAQ